MFLLPLGFSPSTSLELPVYNPNPLSCSYARDIHQNPHDEYMSRRLSVFTKQRKPGLTKVMTQAQSLHREAGIRTQTLWPAGPASSGAGTHHQC